MQHLQPNTTLQGGKYKIERVLGQGGFGITYLAEQVALNRQVAIKEFFIESLCDRSVNESTIMGTISSGSGPMVDRYKQKFLKEARLISELHHENIINVYDVFEENGTAYYVMEYIDGGSLGSLLQQKGKLTEGEAVNYIKKIANAIEYIHQRKINHFDIKPDNIMLRRDNTPVLIDFGISKRYDYAGAATTTTPVGISNGYAPIEQYSADGVASFSPQTDIYSLGATLYKLVTGQTPPSAPARSGGASFNLPTTLSPSIRNVIDGAMKIYKDERIANAKQFLDTLAGYGQQPMESQQPEGSSVWKYVVAGLIAIVLIIVGYNIYDNSQTGITASVPVIEEPMKEDVENGYNSSEQPSSKKNNYEDTQMLKDNNIFDWSGDYLAEKDAGGTYGGTPVIFQTEFSLKRVNDDQYEGTMEINGYQTYFSPAKIKGYVNGNRIRIYFISSSDEGTNKWSDFCNSNTPLLSLVVKNGTIESEWYATLCELEVVDQTTPVTKQ